MLKLIYFKSDLKQLYREPMMALFFMLPIIMAPLFKVILLFVYPFSQRFFIFELAPYNDFILSLVLLLVPGMLGVVMGFMLLDDKDGKIIELLSITPLGRSGYIIIRLTFIAIATMIYTIYSYYVMELSLVTLPAILFIGMLLCIYATIIGLIFINLATDKVKGLTYAKGLNIMLIFVFADLLKTPWITFFAQCFPTYWVYKIIETHAASYSLFFGLLVHLLWFMIMLTISKKKL
ncbi:MAG: hypothetical protein ABF289_10760 [Clostridiales bacterium]